jgi:L-cysteine S-thiosulfotransferase
MRWRAPLAVCCFFSAVANAQDERPIALEQLKSGREFAGTAVGEMQDDELANSGMLWVEAGAKLWREPAGQGKPSCEECHGEATKSMKGVAARYPVFDEAAKKVLNLEQRVNRCREKQQEADPYPYESESLLSITAFIAYQSRGEPMKVSIDGPARAHFAAGKDFYYRRMGQMNLACHHCHNVNWGRRLLSETVSQGHGNAYPIYRLEWQSVGSLHRRFRSCLSGIRAEMLPYGAQEYVDLELYLAWRAQSLPIEAPGVRR